MASSEVLPPGLENLYDRLLSSLDVKSYTHACQLFRLVLYRPRPFLLELYFADNEKNDSFISAPVKTFLRD
jgi:hypothetical protein